MNKREKKRRKISKISLFLISLIWIIAVIFTIFLIFNSIKNKKQLSKISSNIPIPDGFYYVGGNIDTGVVISDNKEDEFKGSEYDKVAKLKGNQFVWVPVEKAVVEDINEAKKIVNQGKNPLVIKDGERYKSINYVFDSYTKNCDVFGELKFIGTLEPYIVQGDDRR